MGRVRLRPAAARSGQRRRGGLRLHRRRAADLRPGHAPRSPMSPSFRRAVTDKRSASPPILRPRLSPISRAGRSASPRARTRTICSSRPSRARQSPGPTSSLSISRPPTPPRRSRAARRLVDHRIAVFMCNAIDNPLRERRHIEQLLGERVDGLIVTARRAGGTRVGSATPTRRRSRMRRVATIQLDWLLITSSCQACLPAGSPCLATVYTPSRQISACRPWAFWPLCCP